MSSIRLSGVRKSFGDFQAVKNIDLEIAQGEFVTLLGGSGSGKTTCLRIVAGFLRPDEGRVHIDGQDVTHVPPHRRDMAMMFQNYALFPHLTVAQNVAYGLTIRRLPRQEIARRTEEALAMVQLQPYADRYPGQLSGGQKQRVALARAVVIRPKVMLLDEPLGALDLKLRQELQIEIKKIQKQLGITTLFVTHDQSEALSMSDRLVVMREGAVLHADTPIPVYRRPSNRYVADLVGRMNFFDAVVKSRNGPRGGCIVELAHQPGVPIEISADAGQGFKAGERCVIGVRPEDLDFGEPGGEGVAARVVQAFYNGDNWAVSCTSAVGDSDIQAVLPARSTVPQAGDRITLKWSTTRCVLLPHA